MRSVSCILMFTLLGLLSCSEEPDGKPALSQMEMVPLVYQLMLVDEISLDYQNRDSTRRMDSIRSRKYDQVFDLNQVDYKTFKESYDYYLARPDQLKLIFDSVEAYGNRDRLARMIPSASQPVTKPKLLNRDKKPE
ncbi:hypothetical protein GCM10027036_00160 [Flavihumibacter cheonanensis]|uniref:DUF4296 domain-containing protein n=1 Tax=Flavihumibacter cheonanensis TaxID=1442385 RepID=UPI001EF7E09D|nr:DUF4296 domain-containing protein [Flavihumibacter cheonanensis]MCG7752537.1 DUF4296 domain-containing protein [Flavihumibacter cheonanensis]